MSFTNDILKVLKKHQKYKEDAGVLTNELIQISCALAFDWLGNRGGYDDLRKKLDACYEYSVENHFEDIHG